MTWEGLPGPKCDFHFLSGTPQPCFSLLPYAHLTHKTNVFRAQILSTNILNSHQIFVKKELAKVLVAFLSTGTAALMLLYWLGKVLKGCLLAFSSHICILCSFFLQIRIEKTPMAPLNSNTSKFKWEHHQVRKPGPEIVSRTCWIQVFVGKGSLVQLLPSDPSPNSKLIKNHPKSICCLFLCKTLRWMLNIWFLLG